MPYGHYDETYTAGAFGRASDLRRSGAHNSGPSYSALAGDPPPSNSRPSAPGEGLSGWERAIAIQNAGTNMAPPPHADGFFWAFSDPVDPIDHLPPAARTKLETLREHRFTVRSLNQPMFDRVREAHLDLIKARTELADLERKYDARMDRHNPQSNPARDAFEASIEEHRGKVARLQSEYARVSAIRDAAAERAGKIGSLLENNVERFLQGHIMAGAKFVALDLPAAKPRKGENIVDAISRVRAEIEKTKADIEATAGAAITAAMAKAKARAEIERLAAEGRPSVVNLRLYGEAVAWPKTALSARIWAVAGEAPVIGSARDQIAAGHHLVAWLFKDQLIKALDAEIDGFDAGPGLADDQRAARTFELTASLFALECEEEALIDVSAAQHTEILRRSDADPRAVLGIAVS